ncbi:hypothetical protein [Streptomyces niveus]|uniref:hypothetical protein n=1 Tax=Streptomyces niveus TaxID=193462 RepID=UPI003422541E
MPDLPSRFHLQRHHDVTGASGTGRVADGVLWPDGTATLRWRGQRPSTVNWDRIDDAVAIHGHGGHTGLVWDDPDPSAEPQVSVCQAGEISPEAAEAILALSEVAKQQMLAGCPHCPDGHTPPDGGSQPWGAYVSSERDGDGQPTTIHVARSGGAHVAESDAQWIRDRLNPTT